MTSLDCLQNLRQGSTYTLCRREHNIDTHIRRSMSAHLVDMPESHRLPNLHRPFTMPPEWSFLPIAMTEG